MGTLRLTQHKKDENKYLIELALEGAGARQTATVECETTLTPQEQEQLRWYLEDYLDAPHDPAPQIAAGIEKRLTELGGKLFREVFQGNEDARDLWANLRQNLNNTRIELITGVQEAAAIPWELLRDPKTDVPLALRAQAFVRTYSNPVQRPNFAPQASRLSIRILLVICRPGAQDDVPFRSVAMKILKGLHEDARKVFEIDVLRPPTFEQLGKTLRQAKAEGKPYHVVHFDGHGAFLDLGKLFKQSPTEFDKEVSKVLKSNCFAPQDLYPETPRDGNHGYLCFENPQVSDNMRLVDGSALGKLLVETDVPVLVLNACRSAHADSPSPNPSHQGRGTEPPLPSWEGQGEGVEERSDPHTQVRAFGSLAQEVMDTGVAGVAAMRYNVYVVTAAQFVVDLYAALAQGQALGEAVTFGRKQLKDQPLREIAYKPIPLQDWIVPVVYEAAPIPLFPKPVRPTPGPSQEGKEGSIPSWEGLGVGFPKITLTAGETTPTRGVLDADLPKEPDVGFYGRDETLLTIERAFDTQPIVLLHAYAGSGKTTTAAEFARWYALTGGVEVALFTTFERYLTLAQVFGKIERVFGGLLEQNHIHFLALDAEQQRNVTLQVLAYVPTLWIWDNVEPIAGLPTRPGHECPGSNLKQAEARSQDASASFSFEPGALAPGSLWTSAEQRALADFLRDARQTKAKFLLTSRRDEKGWLGDLPRRIKIPKMPMRERVLLARAIAERHGRRITEVEDWKLLLEFTQGNPLTITVLVGQAFRDGLTTRKQIADFVAKLRAGEAAFDDEESEGRSKSLGASLQYGFGHAFSEDERKKLALLHFFQGFVEVEALKLMGHPEAEWSLPEIRNMSSEKWIDLLDRAAEVGLLTKIGDGYYHIHPALPWYFKSLFERYYTSEISRLVKGNQGEFFQATRAFVLTMSDFGDYYFWQYENGNSEVIHILNAEESNLLYAMQLGRKHGWWRAVIGTMQGLGRLYKHIGRQAELKRLVEEIVPDFIDPITDGPLIGREEQWSLVTQYRVLFFHEAHDWVKAERLQRLRVEWDRQQVITILTTPVEAMNSDQRNQIRTLAASLQMLGIIQRGTGQKECIKSSKESFILAEQIEDQSLAAASAFELGYSYKVLPDLCDLEQAEVWYRRSIELCDKGNHLLLSTCLSELGSISYECFQKGIMSNQPKEELLRHINAAINYSYQALNLLPASAVNKLADIHHQIGGIYNAIGDLKCTLFHYQESIRYNEMSRNLHSAATSRVAVAGVLLDAERFEDALLYAQAALRNFATYGDRAAAEIQKMQELIALIEQDMKK